MTTFVWAAAFVCWGIAALLIVSLACPDLFQPRRWAHREEARGRL